MGYIYCGVFGDKDFDDFTVPIGLCSVYGNRFGVLGINELGYALANIDGGNEGW